ncbi:MAG TPA: nuclear transport factor 2 family protein [Burkholderiales bacterium]|nr:nuclear transport factor 2 family protein [Burkholderiales bacterium]
MPGAGIEARFEELLSRLQSLEDEREVRNVIVRYCFAVDSEDADATQAQHWEDCVVNIDDQTFYRGSEVRNIVTGPGQQAILPECAHVMVPFIVEMKGARATATGYASLIVKDKEGPGSYILRQACTRIDLEKRNGVWKISTRVSYVAGSNKARELLRNALDPPS